MLAECLAERKFIDQENENPEMSFDSGKNSYGDQALKKPFGVKENFTIIQRSDYDKKERSGEIVKVVNGFSPKSTKSFAASVVNRVPSGMSIVNSQIGKVSSQFSTSS